MKRNLILILGMIMCAGHIQGQSDSIFNAAERLLNTSGKLTIGGYGEVHYNQPIHSELKKTGTLDVHRMVLLFGYRFNKKTQFITELEMEHVKELYVEQAFLQYRIHPYMNLRGGLMLVPIGIVNEYHEPTTFNGVERPLVDKYVVPSTWREIGIGLSGNILPLKAKYQAYILNGFNGYDEAGNFNGKNGLRKGRQKGAESYISSPTYTAKINYYGISTLNIGGSFYHGKSQSVLFNNLDNSDKLAKTTADSSSVGITIVGLDARFLWHGIQLKGQFTQIWLSNTDQYNVFTGDTASANDLGSAIRGYYVEAGYNLFHITKINDELIPFIRWSQYDTHAQVDDQLTKNDSYNKIIITAGLGWKPSMGTIFKIDWQSIKSKADNQFSHQINAGIGIWF